MQNETSNRRSKEGKFFIRFKPQGAEKVAEATTLFRIRTLQFNATSTSIKSGKVVASQLYLEHRQTHQSRLELRG